MKKLFPIVTVLIALALIVCQRSEVGWISIQSTPEGAEVYLDDSLTGEVTNCLLEVEAGDHTVKLVREDYKDWVRDVTVEEGDTVELNAYVYIPDTVKPGNVLWKYEIGEWDYGGGERSYDGYSPAIVLDGVIYCTNNEGYLYAINPDGSMKWKYNVGTKPTSPTIGPDGTIYVGTSSALKAIDSDGQENWSYPVEAGGVPAIALSGDIYLPSFNGNLYALDPNGNLEWTYNIVDARYYDFNSPAVGGEGTIYCSAYDRGCPLYALSPDGELIWRYSAWIPYTSLNYMSWGPFVTSPSIDSDSEIYYGSFSVFGEEPDEYWEYHLIVINHDGSMRTAYQLSQDAIVYSPSVDQSGRVYFGAKNQLMCLDESSGKFQTYNVPVCSSPTIGSDGAVYFGSPDGNFYAIGPVAILKWSVNIGATYFSSPAITSEGVIYVAANDGFLYAIYSESQGLANSSWPKMYHDNQNTSNATWVGW